LVHLLLLLLNMVGVNQPQKANKNKKKNTGSTKPVSRSMRKQNNSNNVNSKKGAVAIPAFLSSVANPWRYPSAHVPDQATSNSGLCTSTAFYETSFSNANATTSTTHCFGFCLPPYPYYTQFSQTTAANITDVDTAGTNYWLPASNSVQASPLLVPNGAAVLGTTTPEYQRSKIRCTGISLSVTYEGTELQRAGKYIAALVPATGAGTTHITTGTVISLLGACIGQNVNDYAPAIVNVKNQASAYTECRISDTPFVCRWLPNGSPSYQLAAGPTPENYTVGAGAPALSPTVWNSPAGAAGLQAGQNVLVFLVVGDTTPTAVVNSNPYNISIKWNWEVIPDSTTSVAYTLRESPSSGMLLDKCLNAMQGMTVGIIPGNGSARV
jgi:hypothetical protein